jgi:hypothetical protein
MGESAAWYWRCRDKQQDLSSPSSPHRTPENYSFEHRKPISSHREALGLSQPTLESTDRFWQSRSTFPGCPSACPLAPNDIGLATDCHRTSRRREIEKRTCPSLGLLVQLLRGVLVMQRRPCVPVSRSAHHPCDLPQWLMVRASMQVHDGLLVVSDVESGYV